MHNLVVGISSSEFREFLSSIDPEKLVAAYQVVDHEVGLDPERGDIVDKLAREYPALMELAESIKEGSEKRGISTEIAWAHGLGAIIVACTLQKFAEGGAFGEELDV